MPEAENASASAPEKFVAKDATTAKHIMKALLHSNVDAFMIFESSEMYMFVSMFADVPGKSLKQTAARHA
jgi:hypothetical protein